MNLILYAACLLSGLAYAQLKSMIQDPVFPQVHRFCFSAFQNGLRFPRRFYFLAAIGSDLHNHLKSLSHLFSSSQLVLNKHILASILHATVRWVGRIHGTWLHGKYRVYVSLPQSSHGLRRIQFFELLIQCYFLYLFRIVPLNTEKTSVTPDVLRV